jgi:hypothetical protein
VLIARECCCLLLRLYLESTYSAMYIANELRDVVVSNKIQCDGLAPCRAVISALSFFSSLLSHIFHNCMTQLFAVVLRCEPGFSQLKALPDPIGLAFEVAEDGAVFASSAVSTTLVPSVALTTPKSVPFCIATETARVALAIVLDGRSTFIVRWV